MAVRLGDVAPDFTAETTQGTVHFHQWKDGKWAILFSHPKDFTPVCTTELGAVAALMPEFERRNCRVIGLSVAPVASHHQWEGNIAEVTGLPVTFPRSAAPDRVVSMLCVRISPNASDTLTVPWEFMIGQDDRVTLLFTYPAIGGRHLDEILGALDALQLTANWSVSTPNDWRAPARTSSLPTPSPTTRRSVASQGTS